MAISEILDELNFFEMLSDDRSNLEILREHFPMRKAINLYGFLEAVKIFGENFYKDQIAWIHRKTLITAMPEIAEKQKFGNGENPLSNNGKAML